MGVQLHKFASACMLYVKLRDDSKAGSAVAHKVCRLAVIDSLGEAARLVLGLVGCPPCLPWVLGVLASGLWRY